LGSESSIAPETIQAYREADYRVFSDIPVTLRIAEKNEALLGLYKANRSDSCAFVTACNPLGQQLSEAENASLQYQLARELEFRSLNFISGEGKHPVCDWPGESSFLVFGLSLEENWNKTPLFGAALMQCRNWSYCSDTSGRLGFVQTPRFLKISLAQEIEIVSPQIRSIDHLDRFCRFRF
jgi:hypothetical protein